IAADEQFVFARKETKAARTMAGNFQNLEFGAEKISGWRFFDEKIRFRRFDFEFETEVAKKFPVGNHWRGERVTTDLTAKLALDHRIPTHMSTLFDHLAFRAEICQDGKPRNYQ